MLHWLLSPLQDQIPTLRLINYLAFRGAGAAVTALLLSFLVGPVIIRRLRAMKVQQGVRQGTPDSHKGKAATPTMGGLVLLAAGIGPAILWTRLDNPYVLVALIVTIWMGGIGFLDDYLKLKQKREGRVVDGLVERYKLAGQVTIALGAQVNINLTVGTDIVRKMSLALLKPLDIEEGWAPRAYVKFNNEGNVAEYLDGGTFEVYDQFGAARLAYIQKGKEGLPEIPAFTIKDFTIEFPTDFYLGVGQYWASINLVQEGKSVGTQRTVFNVLTKGSLSTPLERFLLDLKANWQRSLGIGVIVFAALIAIWRFVRRRKQ